MPRASPQRSHRHAPLQRCPTGIHPQIHTHCNATQSLPPARHLLQYLTVDDGRLRGFQLAMTRALGHRLLAQYGVASAPSGACLPAGCGRPVWPAQELRQPALLAAACSVPRDEAWDLGLRPTSARPSIAAQ